MRYLERRRGMSDKTKMQTVVTMLDPATVRTLDTISDERLCTRSEVLRDLAERAAAKWRKRKGKR